MDRSVIRLILLVVLLGATSGARAAFAAEWSFIRGDIDGNGTLTIGDAVMALGYLFGGVPAPCHDALDVNDDGLHAIDDPIVLLTYLFTGGASPAAPFPTCGTDPTPDSLECVGPTVGCGPAQISVTVTGTALLVAGAPAAGATVFVAGAGETIAGTDGGFSLAFTMTTPLSAIFVSAELAIGPEIFRASGLAITDLATGLASAGILSLSARYTAQIFPAERVAEEAGDSYHAWTVGDFDGDLILDLVARLTGGSVILMGGDGAGRFAPVSTSPTLGTPLMHLLELTNGDFDGDGDLDVIAGHLSLSPLSFLRNDGTGVFLPPVALYASMLGNFDLFPRDLDADGDLDLAFSGRAQDLSGPPTRLVTLINDGAASFSVGTVLLFTPYTRVLDLHDHNSDSVPDLLSVSNAAPAGLSIHLGNGVGSFAGPVLIPDSLAGIWTRSADISEDGIPDLIIRPYVYPGALSSLQFLFGDGSGAFGGASLLTLPVASFENSQIVDLEQDGHLDLVGTAPSNRLIAVRGLGSSSFGPVEYSSHVGNARFFAGDFTNDGALDVLSGSALYSPPFSSFALLFGGGGGSFETNQELSSGPYLSDLVAVDLTGDERPDLLTSRLVQDVAQVWLAGGPTGFGAVTELSAGLAPRSLAVGDLDDDGDVDFATVNEGSDDMSLFWNGGAGVFPTSSVVPAGSSPHAAAFTDLNGDSIRDFAVVSATFSNLRLFLASSAGNYTVSYIEPMPGAPHLVRSADLNGDGAGDLVVLKFFDPTISLRFGDGAGGVAAGVELDEFAIDVELVDLDYDGDLDLLTSSGSGLCSWLNDGSGGFTASWDVALASYGGRIAIGDFDGDGLRDVAVTSQARNALALLFGTSDFSLEAPRYHIIGVEPTHVGVLDLELDGDLDLAVGSASEDTIDLIINRRVP